LNVEEADRILQGLWDVDAQAWDTYWVPIFGKFAHDLATDAHLSVGQVVLDVGTGTGVAAMEALKRSKASGMVLGIDRSVTMLELAKQKYGQVKNLRFLMTDAKCMPFPDEFFDAAISNSGMSYSTFRETITEIFRVVRRGGSFTFNDWHLIDVPAHKIFSEILRRHRTGHPSESLSRCRAAVAVMEHVGNQYADKKIQAEELERVGFIGVQVKRREYKIKLQRITDYIVMRLEREALKQELKELSEAEQAAFIKELRAALKPFTRTGAFIMEWKVTFTHVTKPS